MNALNETIASAVTRQPFPTDPRARHLVERLGTRSLVIVGMMGAGKTVIGRRVAARLGLGFVDTDHEIETAACLTILEIFERHGEAHFRDRESRVVARVIADGPKVVATGGGAFIHADTRAALRAHAITIWLKADLAVLMRRVRKATNRPLLQTPELEDTMKRLIADRYPIYAEADVTVHSRDQAQDTIVTEILNALEVGPLARVT